LGALADEFQLHLLFRYQRMEEMNQADSLGCFLLAVHHIEHFQEHQVDYLFKMSWMLTTSLFHLMLMIWTHQIPKLGTLLPFSFYSDICMAHLHIMAVFDWRENSFSRKLFSMKNIFPRKLIFISHFPLFDLR